MDNKIDKYFKEKLHDREFAFQDSYWEGAQKLLDGQERRRRRGLFFWWFGGIAGLVALVAGIWFFTKNDGLQNVPASLVERNEVKSMEGLSVQENENTASANDPDSIKENIPTAISAEKTMANDRNINLANKKSGNMGGSRIKHSFSKKPPIANELGHGKPFDETPAYNSYLNNLIKPEKEGNSSMIETDMKELMTEEKNNQAIEIAENEPEEEPENTHLFNHLDFLDLKQVFVKGEFPRTLTPNETKGKTKKSSPLAFCVMAGQMFQLGAKNGEKTIIGYQGGLVLQYKVKGNWYIGSGLQYKYRTGSFDASKSAIGRNYRFGLETDTFVLRPSSLHYLSLPIQLGWQKGRHVLEAGFAFDYLIGVRGEKGRYERTSEPPIRREFQAEQKGWLVEDGYNSFNAAAMLGYRYRVNRQLSFGLGANYTFGGILNKGFEAPVGSFLLEEADKFYLDLRAVYLIK
ncbi:MAG: outer membrane beta-barrel protein [Saprospiraceae bacterium]